MVNFHPMDERVKIIFDVKQWTEFVLALEDIMQSGFGSVTIEVKYGQISQINKLITHKHKIRQADA